MLEEACRGYLLFLAAVVVVLDRVRPKRIGLAAVAGEKVQQTKETDRAFGVPTAAAGPCSFRDGEDLAGVRSADGVVVSYAQHLLSYLEPRRHDAVIERGC